MNALLRGVDPSILRLCAIGHFAPMPLLMAADLLADPRSEVLQVLSRGLHLSALVLACMVFLAYARIPSQAFVVILVAITAKVLDSYDVFRDLYLVLICLIFACAGYCAATYSRRHINILLLGLLGFSTGMALLQVLGIYEWPYLLSRHGYLGDGGMIPLTITPTFLRGPEALNELTLYQARPSSIFSSNQLYTGFLLFVSARVLVLRGSVGWISAILLSAGVAFSSSKAALLGVPLLALAALIFVPPARRQALRILVTMMLVVVVYAQVFPGVVAASLSYRGLMSSILVRVLDLITAIVETLGLQGEGEDVRIRILSKLDQTLAESASYGVSQSAGLGWKILEKVDQTIAQTAVGGLSESTGLGWKNRQDIRPVAGASGSLIATAVRNPLQSAMLGLLVLLVTLHSGKCSPKFNLQADFLVIFAVTLFGMISDPSSSPLYWYWAGFGCRFVWGRWFHRGPESLMFASHSSGHRCGTLNLKTFKKFWARS